MEELELAYTTTLIDATNKAEDFKVLYASIVQNTEDPAKVPTIVGVYHAGTQSYNTCASPCVP